MARHNYHHRHHHHHQSQPHHNHQQDVVRLGTSTAVSDPADSYMLHHHQHRHQHQHQSAAHGLGLMDCSLPYALHGAVGGAPTSPAPSLPWSHSTLHGQLQPGTPKACHSRSSIAYDYLPAFQPSSPAATSIGSPFPLTSTCLPEASPSPNGFGAQSHRSSLSSDIDTSGYSSPHESDPSFGSHPMLAGSQDWLVHEVGGLSLQVSLSHEARERLQALLPSTSPYTAFEQVVVDDVGAGAGSSPALHDRPRRHTYEGAGFPSAGGLSPAPSSHDGRRPSATRIQFPLSGSAARSPRKRRQLTSKAEANHECEICHKFFERRYNYRAHMATHDPDRAHPHKCEVEWCDRKFVRKTDLMRHHQSVHLKQREFRCEMCSRPFARKDTLRRHTEDGCAKRFQVPPEIFQLSTSSPNVHAIPRLSPCSVSSPDSATTTTTIPLELSHTGEYMTPGAAAAAAAARYYTDAEAPCITLLPTTGGSPMVPTMEDAAPMPGHVSAGSVGYW